MRSELREYAERIVADARPLTDEEVRKLALLLAPAVRRLGRS